ARYGRVSRRDMDRHAPHGTEGLTMKRRALVFAFSFLPFALVAFHFSLVPFAFSLFPSPLSAERQAAQAPAAAPKYDLLLRGGHVVDARNKISAVRDVAIAGGKIA